MQGLIAMPEWMGMRLGRPAGLRPGPKRLRGETCHRRGSERVPGTGPHGLPCPSRGLAL